MVRMSVFYPETEGATFDYDYYRDNHVPLAVKTWNPQRAEIDRGVSGPFVAAVHFVFESREQLDQAMASEGSAAIGADVANYTTIRPLRQISEVVS
jgi:uncharacterized protein (TIGR02118 family)